MQAIRMLALRAQSDCAGPVHAVRWDFARSGFCPAGSRRDGEHCVAPPTRMPPGAKLSVANALALGPRRNVVAKEYRAQMQSAFQAEVFEAAAADAVNDWVKLKTEGRIPQILEQLDPNTSLVLLNAVYFKAQWQSFFDVGATHEADFHLNSSRRSKVPTMHRTGSYRTITTPEFRAVRLPYDIGRLAMVIVLSTPRAGDIAKPPAMGNEAVTRLLLSIGQAKEKRLALALPRFSAVFRNDELAQIFQQLGITRAFDSKMADFSGMTGRPPRDTPIYLQRILHRAVIDVTERGTEAAAVTAAEMRLVSAPVEAEPELF